MDEEGYEQFDLNQRDLDNALDPTRRFNRRQTKDQQIYGIWADEEEVDDKPSYAKSSAVVNNLANFVSGGTTAQIAEAETAVPQKKPRMHHSASAGANLGAKFGNRFAGEQQPQSSAFSSKIKNMMKKMGHREGTGLGVRGDGIVEPILASVRQGKGGVGAYGKEASAAGPNYGETAAEAQAREKAEADGTVDDLAPRKGQWKKDRQQKKTAYRTIDDVIADGGPEVTGMPSSMKIIDMTGPQQKVYDNFHSFARKAQAPETEASRTKFDMPELVHNLNSLLDLTEDEIRRNDRQMKTLREQNRTLEAEMQDIHKAITDEEAEIRRMEEIHDIIATFASSSQQSLDECKQLLLRLKREFAVEYRLYGLDSIALSNVMPMLRSYFEAWKPLKGDEPDFGMSLVQEWQEILQGEGKAKKHMFDRLKSELDSLPAFDRCMWEAWVPVIRRDALKWDVRRESAIMLDVICTWMDILPNWIVDNVLEQLILPRIKETVDAWDPTRDVIPIDSWLVPWHRVLGHKLMPIYSPIRQKFAKALRNWEVSDKTALVVIRPWNGVFTAATMRSFLNINIVPKLENALLMMNLNPNENPRVPEFMAVIEWLELIGPEVTCQVLMKNFFPRWLDNLVMWLTETPTPAPLYVLKEIAGYYSEWKGRFPPVLAEIPSIKAELHRALQLIGQKKNNQPIQLVTAPTPQEPPRTIPRFPVHPAPQRNTMREMVEDTAHRLGIDFIPQNRMEQGRPVYQLGKLLIYFHNEFMYHWNPVAKEWHPITVDDALDFAAR